MTARRDHGFTLVELAIVIVIVGTLAAMAIPAFYQAQVRAKEAEVRQNMHTVQLAAETFAVGNEGVYPVSTVAVGPDGDAMADLLPQGQLLRNPFTGNQTEPFDGAAVTPGAIGYAPFLVGGEPAGYDITGFGQDALLLTLHHR